MATSPKQEDLGVEERGKEINVIKDLLNDYLGTSYSLVEFDGLSGLPLLQKLNDVFAQLNPDMARDLAGERAQNGGSMGPTFVRMTNFLHSILNYKLPNTLRPNFEQTFCYGEKQVVYPILHWVLSHIPQNKKRVYLSKYLIPIEVPEDLRASDDGVREVYGQYKQLIEEFIQTHRNVEKLKENVTDPQDVGRMIKTLEQERETLKQRISQTREKLKTIPNNEALLKAAQALRQAQEEQGKMQEQMDAQTSSLHSAEMKLASSEQTLKELKRDLSGFSAEEMIKRIQEDVKMSQMLVTDKLPKDTDVMSQKLRTLHATLNENVDLQALQHKVATMEAEVASLQKENEERMKDKDAHQLHLFRQQALLTTGRKAGFLDELETVKSEIAKVKAEIASKEEDLSRFSNEKIPKGEDFVRYVNSLRENYSNYKRMGAELGELRSEYGVLQRTEELLLAKVDRNEYQGLKQTKQTIEELNEQRSGLDDQKSEKLEKLSEVVQEFVAEIRERRSKLAPQILELRNTRQKAHVVETSYQHAKESYEAEQARLEAETGKLQEEVDQLSSDTRLNESLYHRLNAQLSIAAVAWNRVRDEKDFAHGDRKLDEQYNTWAKMFESVTKKLETKSQTLRVTKKDIEQNHDHNLQQMEWFRNLKRLLDCKVNYYKRETQDKERDRGNILNEGMVIGGTGNATVMVLSQ
eukprot:TRINITY_DN29904_c0_g1_i1.p1 TRINITY_DN29904_c0_g1~~TRINITY_DN29904_c0_g1_i1.p1  ORF type:complete len:712 (+),score=348.20 TRINITY_DN29904_c0_g1_i1:56-2137(+)